MDLYHRLMSYQQSFALHAESAPVERPAVAVLIYTRVASALQILNACAHGQVVVK